jgi:hypothetical protein
MFITEPVEIEVPSPKVIFKVAKPSERANQAILCAIKTQTERLRRIFIRIADLKKVRYVKEDNFNFNWVSEVSRSERFHLLEHKVKVAVMETELRLTNARRNRAIRKQQREEMAARPSFIQHSEMDELLKWTQDMIERATSEFRAFQEDAKEKVEFLRSKIDMINARLDQFGDFSGDSKGCMTFLDMKVSDVVDMSQRPDEAAAERGRNKRLVESMLKLNYTIEKGVSENAVAELWRKAKRLKWVIPLVNV